MRGGIQLNGKKDSSLVSWTVKKIKVTAKVRILLDEDSVLCVSEGDTVQRGQRVADPSTETGIAHHASIPGRVTAIRKMKNFSGREVDCIELAFEDQNETFPGVGTERPGWQVLGKDELVSLFQESGIVDMAGGPLPPHVEAVIARQDVFETLVINACESEPYVTADHSLLMSHPVEVLKGAEILRKVFGAQRVVIALEDNKLEVAEVVRSKIYFLKWEHFDVAVFPARYPQGSPVVLAQDVSGKDIQLTRRRDAPGYEENVFLKAIHDVGICVQAVATAFSVYEAVAFQKPLIERAVTVGGECVIEPRNVWLPVGISIEDAFKTCRGLMRSPGKVVMGGPMQGLASESMDQPVTKMTQAVLALPLETVKAREAEPCIHCNRCVEVCPMGLSPVMMSLAAEKGAFDQMNKLGIDYCIECGNCTYVCPSGIYLNPKKPGLRSKD